MPDEARDIQVFHQTRGVMIVFGVFTAGLACAVLSALFNADSRFLAAMFVLIFGTGFVILLVNLSRSLTLHGPQITIAFTAGKKRSMPVKSKTSTSRKDWCGVSGRIKCT